MTSALLHWALAASLLQVLFRDWRKAIPLSLLLWIPCGPHGIGVLRSVFGELGAGALVVVALVWQRRPLREVPGLRPAAALVVIAGFLLCVTCLGLLPGARFPVYEAGFDNPWLLVGIGLFGLAAVLLRWWWPAAWIGLSLLAWNLGLPPSGNIWDQLIGLPVWALSAGFLCANLRRRKP